MKVPTIILRKSAVSLLFFLVMVFVLLDTVLGFNWIFKLGEKAWYASPPGLFIVAILLVLCAGSLNDFLSRVLVYDDHMELKSLLGKKIYSYTGADQLIYTISKSASTPMGFFIMLDKKADEQWRLPVSYVKSNADKHRFIESLLSSIPGLKIDHECETFLNK